MTTSTLLKLSLSIESFRGLDNSELIMEEICDILNKYCEGDVGFNLQSHELEDIYLIDSEDYEVVTVTDCS